MQTMNPLASSPQYIQLTNKGGYVAKLDVVYELNASIQKQSTPQMSLGMVRKLFIPPEAQNLQLEFKMADCGWITVGIEYFDNMGTSNMCFLMWGTIFVPQYEKVACDSTILIVDKSKAPCWKPPGGQV